MGLTFKTSAFKTSDAAFQLQFYKTKSWMLQAVHFYKTKSRTCKLLRKMMVLSNNDAVLLQGIEAMMIISICTQ